MHQHKKTNVLILHFNKVLSTINTLLNLVTNKGQLEPTLSPRQKKNK